MRIALRTVALLIVLTAASGGQEYRAPLPPMPCVPYTPDDCPPPPPPPSPTGGGGGWMVIALAVLQAVRLP